MRIGAPARKHGVGDADIWHAARTAIRKIDLRAVAEAAEQVRRDEALVTERVAAARARGRSWNRRPRVLPASSTSAPTTT